jgi:transcriptional regulator with XRE-family HTH domain
MRKSREKGNVGEKSSLRNVISPAQCRAARALLMWTMPKLAAAAQVSVSTINNFETQRRQPIPASIAAIQRALEAAGVEFLPSNGLRLRDHETDVRDREIR